MPAPSRKRRLSREARRALELLAKAPSGYPEMLLSAHEFKPRY